MYWLDFFSISKLLALWVFSISYVSGIEGFCTKVDNTALRDIYCFSYRDLFLKTKQNKKTAWWECFKLAPGLKWFATKMWTRSSGKHLLQGALCRSMKASVYRKRPADLICVNVPKTSDRVVTIWMSWHTYTGNFPILP